MEIQQEIVEFLETLAEIAAGVQQKLAWLLFVGLVASAALAWKAYSPESVTWWNIIKCGSLMLPVLLWCFVWNMLGQLREAPELAATLVNDDELNSDGPNTGESAVTGLKLDNESQSKPKGVRALFAVLREFRQHQGLDVVFDTIGSVTLLANPLFAALAFVMLGFLMLFIIIAPLLFFL